MPKGAGIGNMQIASGATNLPARTDYIADGTGRDTYIRRDPIATYGKQNMRPEYSTISRMGTAGSAIPVQKPQQYNGFQPGERDVVGTHDGTTEFKRTEAFLQPVPLGLHVGAKPKHSADAAAFPLEVNKYTTMKEITQDSAVSTQQLPGHLGHVTGYSGFQPRCAPDAGADWANLDHSTGRR